MGHAPAPAHRHRRRGRGESQVLLCPPPRPTPPRAGPPRLTTPSPAARARAQVRRAGRRPLLRGGLRRSVRGLRDVGPVLRHRRRRERAGPGAAAVERLDAHFVGPPPFPPASCTPPNPPSPPPPPRLKHALVGVPRTETRVSATASSTTTCPGSRRSSASPDTASTTASPTPATPSGTTRAKATSACTTSGCATRRSRSRSGVRGSSRGIISARIQRRRTTTR